MKIRDFHVERLQIMMKGIGVKMLKRFYPKRTAESTYVIDYKKLYQEGYRGIIFDIDNTLVRHDEDATDRAIELFKHIKEIGFKSCLISNNDEERVKRFNKDIKTNYIFDAHKPSRKNYIKATKIMGTTIDTTIFIGDQLFTDIYGANRTGMMSYLVKPISPKEEIQIVFKRRLEKIVLYFYHRDMNKRRSNIVLIGFMGCGKSSVGKALAKQLGYNFIDTDMMIEKKVGSSISQIFETKGEEYFRDMESRILKGILSTINGAVISTGGGLPMRSKNREALKRIGKVVYLKGSKELLVQRLSKDTTRPLLKGEDISKRVDVLLKERSHIYEELAHRIINIDGKSISEIVDEITKR